MTPPSVAGLTVGELKDRLLRASGEEIRRIGRGLTAVMAAAVAKLESGGLLLLEIEATQGESVLALARAVYPRAEIQIQPDLADRDRLLVVSNQYSVSSTQ